MPTKSILIRRILAAILLFNSTIGVLLLLPRNPILEKFLSSSPDTSVYLMIIFLILNFGLIFFSFILSQNTQFLITFGGLDEREQAIKKNIILNSFPSVLIILVVWLFLQYGFISEIFYRTENAIITLDDYWNKLAGSFSLVPALTFPFVVALWTDREIKILNPILKLNNWLLSVAKVLIVAILISGVFGAVALSSLKAEVSHYEDFNKSTIDLQGDSNYEIIINPKLEIDTFKITSNKFNLSSILIFEMSPNEDINLPGSYYTSMLSYNSPSTYPDRLKYPKGEISFSTTFKWDLTHKIFGTPTVSIEVRDLKELTTTMTRSVKITTNDGSCLNLDTFKLKRQGTQPGILELPCNQQPEQIKNLTDYTKAFR